MSLDGEFPPSKNFPLCGISSKLVTQLIVPSGVIVIGIENVTGIGSVIGIEIGIGVAKGNVVTPVTLMMMMMMMNIARSHGAKAW